MIETPIDVKAAPSDALTTASGLASKVLAPGKGQEYPSAADTVTVHYSGWTTDGRLFDSSVKRGQPSRFPLGGVIAGWTEGVQLMVEGERRRFWIPAGLAYGENPGGGRPGGMLVFDIELLSIQKAPKPPALTAPKEAQALGNGVRLQTVCKGEGTLQPKPSDTVTVRLALWSSEGELLQSTEQQGGPAEVSLAQLRIGGLSEAIQTMVPGDQSVVWIPAEVAFGSDGPAAAPEGGLVVQVELVSFEEGIPAPATPEDVAAAPADALQTASGLAHKLLVKGTGTVHPKASDTVTVHYSGWTTDGELFDSSVSRGEPASFGLKQVIRGWTEGVQLMVEGEKRRFWIPARLAYGENPGGGAPGGMLVFDVELLEIAKR